MTMLVDVWLMLFILQEEAKAKEPQITSSRKNRKKKMQKVNAAALLGINCTASSDARNRGDIDNVIIQ